MNASKNDMDYFAKIIYNELIILGIVGMSDPLRIEVPKAIEILKEAGVKVRMVTADSSESAIEIGK